MLKYRTHLGNEIFTHVVLLAPLQLFRIKLEAAQLRLLSILCLLFYLMLSQETTGICPEWRISLLNPSCMLLFSCQKKASWSSGLIRLFRASFAKQKQGKTMQVLPGYLSRAIFLMIWKFCPFFSCIFSFCSLLWEFYRGTCIIPFVASVNFTGSSAGPVVEVYLGSFPSIRFRACITRSNFNEAHDFKWFSDMQQSMFTVHPGRGRFSKRFMHFKLVPKGALYINDILRKMFSGTS